jgi:hypothetical protein
MATSDLPTRPGVGLPAAIDVPSYETPSIASEPAPLAVPEPDVEPEPQAPPKPPPRHLTPAELVTESTRLAVGAVIATGRGLRAILEQAVAVVDDQATAVAPPSAAAATATDLATERTSSAPPAATAPTATSPPASTPSAPVAALRAPGPPDTIMGALPTAALGAGLHAQRRILSALADTHERYGPALDWMLEAPGVSAVYQRARTNIFEWYRRGALEKEQGTTLAVASLQEVSDDGLGYVFANLDLNTILRGFDINPLLENLELSDVILSSTGGLATDALDNVRSQGVTVDDIIARISNRMFRRKAEKIPDGPNGSYGVQQELPPWTTR